VKITQIKKRCLYVQLWKRVRGMWKRDNAGEAEIQRTDCKRLCQLSDDHSEFFEDPKFKLKLG